MKLPSPLPLALCAALLSGGCEVMPPRHGEVVVHDRNASVRVVFSDQDRALIRDYYEERQRRLPPGLAKKGKIPPGHAKRFERGAPIPQGMPYRALPGDLERRLARLPDGYVRVILDTDIYIMNTRTRVVLDIVRDIVDD